MRGRLFAQHRPADFRAARSGLPPTSLGSTRRRPKRLKAVAKPPASDHIFALAFMKRWRAFAEPAWLLK